MLLRSYVLSYHGCQGGVFTTEDTKNIGKPTTPAMAAGLADEPVTWEETLELADSEKPRKKPGPHTRPNARANNARRRAEKVEAMRREAEGTGDAEVAETAPPPTVVGTIGSPVVTSPILPSLDSQP